MVDGQGDGVTKHSKRHKTVKEGRLHKNTEQESKSFPDAKDATGPGSDVVDVINDVLRLGGVQMGWKHILSTPLGLLLLQTEVLQLNLFKVDFVDSHLFWKVKLLFDFNGNLIVELNSLMIVRLQNVLDFFLEVLKLVLSLQIFPVFGIHRLISIEAYRLVALLFVFLNIVEVALK